MIDPVTQVVDAPAVVKANQWSAAEFNATDWTSDPIPAVPPDLITPPIVVTVPACACPVWAYAAADYAPGLHSARFHGALVSDNMPGEAPVIVPIPDGMGVVNIAATGNWYNGELDGPGGYGPDGWPTANLQPIQTEYYVPEAGSDLLTKTAEVQLGALTGLWLNAARTGGIFQIGSSASALVIPVGTSGLALGFLDTNQWCNNDGALQVTLTFLAS